MPSLLEVSGLCRDFASRRGTVHAVSDVSFSLQSGESVGLVGESGCGKSTVGRMCVGLMPPSAGSVMFDGRRLETVREKSDRRGQVQMVFQDPVSSLNPRMKIAASVGEPLNMLPLSRAEKAERVAEMLSLVGIDPSAGRLYPHEFSGGQRQRIAIARALVTRPRFVVCDEAVSALDVSVQAQVLNLLRDLQERFSPAYLFISHNLAVVNFMCSRILVMYFGRLVEEIPRENLVEKSRHPYTRALMDAIPRISGKGLAAPLQGEVPDPYDIPSGCPFHTRCPRVQPLCRQSMPEWRDFGGGHRVRCHFPDCQ